MCNYTPRAPGELPMKLWASVRQLQPTQLQPLLQAHVKQLITNQFKMLTDFDAPAGSRRKYAMKFSLNIHQRKLDKTKDLTRAKCARSQPL
eukprot:scaffold7238_cov54-Phaeocystis_antarctica.AAC.1